MLVHKARCLTGVPVSHSESGSHSYKPSLHALLQHLNAIAYSYGYFRPEKPHFGKVQLSSCGTVEHADALPCAGHFNAARCAMADLSELVRKARAGRFAWERNAAT